MAKEKGPVADFVQTRKRINDYFGCEGDFFVYPLLDFDWTTEGKKIDAVVVKKSGTPMIYKTKDYTMVVAIDCVKIGFIFRNGKNQTQQ